MKNFNFRVLENTLNIKCKFQPVADFNTDDQRKHPIIRYQQRCHDALQEIKKSESKFQEDILKLENEHLKIFAALEKTKSELEQSKKKELEDLANLFNRQIEEAKAKYAEDIDAIEKRSADIASDRIVADEKRAQAEETALAEIATEKAIAAVRRKIEEDSIKADEITSETNFREKELQERARLAKTVQELSEQFANGPMSLDELMEFKALEGRVAEARLEGEEAEIRHKIKMHVIAADHFGNELAHKHKMEEMATNTVGLILERLFEKEIALAYSKLQSGEKVELINILGEHLPKILQGGRGLVDSLRIVSVPGDGQENSVLKILSQFATTLFQTSSFIPAFKDWIRDGESDALRNEAGASSDDPNKGRQDKATFDY